MAIECNCITLKGSLTNLLSNHSDVALVIEHLCIPLDVLVYLSDVYVHCMWLCSVYQL